MFTLRDDIRKYFATAPEFGVYRESNRGEYRVLRCEFPQLMGWSTLRRPKELPRSLKAPYFAGPYAPQALAKDRLSRPHVNRLKVFRDTDDNHMTLQKNDITLKPGPPLHKSRWGELRIGYWKAKNNKEVLIRMYNKLSTYWKHVERKMLKEVCHVTHTGHPNFLQYYGCAENTFWKYHMFEYMPRGDLLHFLKNQKRPLPEATIRKIFVQVVYAISHLHDKDMVHRNLKLENILLGEDYQVRIIDITHTEKTTAQNRGDRFNISKTRYNHEYGPKLYRSPERSVGWGFNPLLDQVWGLGVILYAMIFHKFPYKFTEDEQSTIETVENGVKLIKGKQCPNGAKDLLHEIFQWEGYRWRTFELLDHPWLASYPDISEMKKTNAIGRFTHEYAEAIRNEPQRMLLVRRRMFKHFKLFREDYKRQPAIQAGELGGIHGVLSNARRFLGPRPYGLHEVKQNIKETHKDERLYKEEYWPKLYAFNPIKCKYLGINRAYCKPRMLGVVDNLKRLADKEVPSYGAPPPKRDGDFEEREVDIHAMELAKLI